jgi:hypothetical protein
VVNAVAKLHNIIFRGAYLYLYLYLYLKGTNEDVVSMPEHFRLQRLVAALTIQNFWRQRKLAQVLGHSFQTMTENVVLFDYRRDVFFALSVMVYPSSNSSSL